MKPWPTPLVLALGSAVLLGWSTVPAYAAEPAARDSADAHAKKGGGKKGKKGKDKNDRDGVGPFKKKDYPTALRLRPLVLPDKMGEASLDLGFGKVLDTTFIGTNLGIEYGIGDNFDFGASTGLALSPEFAWNKTLGLQAHYLAHDTKPFDFAPGILVPLVLAEGAGFSVAIDLPCKYVTPSNGFFFRFGQGAIPVTLSPDFGLAIAGNGGVGFQFDAKSALTVDLNVFQFALAPDSGATGLWDGLNTTIAFQYTPVRVWDIGARLGLSNQFGVEDSFLFNVAAFGAYRF
jgi:hypothetical protein